MSPWEKKGNELCIFLSFLTFLRGVSAPEKCLGAAVRTYVIYVSELFKQNRRESWEVHDGRNKKRTKKEEKEINSKHKTSPFIHTRTSDTVIIP